MWANAGNSAVKCGTVLVVEDDPSSRRALTQLLKMRGFNIVWAATLSEAMQRLESHPECVLLDLMLPDGSGAALLQHIRSRNLPIRVAVTTGAGNWHEMLGTGPVKPDALFVKPIDFAGLIEWLEET